MKLTAYIRIALFICFFYSENLKAQYIKMPLDSNHVWQTAGFYVTPSGQNELLNFAHRFKVVQESVINGKKYQNIQCINRAFDKPLYLTCIEDGSYFVRQDTVAKRIWCLVDGVDRLLYDFSKNVGDTLSVIPLDGFGTLIVDTVKRIDSLLLNDGRYHKRYYYQSNPNYPIIEGVGSTCTFMLPYNWIAFESWSGLSCFTKLHPVYFEIYASDNTGCKVNLSASELGKSKNGIKLFPNPGSGTFHIQLPETEAGKNHQVQLKNSLGQVLLKQDLGTELNYQLPTHQFASGIYFLSVYTEVKMVGESKLMITK